MKKTSCYTLVPAQAADLDALVALSAQGFAHPWTQGFLKGELENPAGLVLKALGPQQTLAGFVCAAFAADESEVRALAVAPAFRRRGVAGLLLESVIDSAIGRGCRIVLLEVRIDNRAALELYKLSGFVETGTRKRYYADQTDALLLARVLKPGIPARLCYR